MKAIVNKKTVETAIGNISFEKSENNGVWFSVKNKTGGTCLKPYGFISLAELKELKNQIDYFLKENKAVENFNKIIIGA